MVSPAAAAHSRLAISGLSAIVLILAIALPWFSAADHALYPPDEGRYASASYWMSQSADWLVPQFQGEAHLTKPPLVYWMQAAGLRWIGHNELAVRLPSLLASTVLSLLVYAAGVRWGGRRHGLFAVALLACMPLQMIVGRMAIIDPTLACCWFAALLCGLAAIERGDLRWVGGLWLAIALGLMAKGPIALIPLLVIIVWMALAGRMREVFRLRPLVGFPLAAAPVVIWAIMVVRAHPEALSIWIGQTAGRIVGEAGTNAHAAPPWYYVPVFLAGLFPATVMIPLPWINYSWREGWQVLRSGNQQAFWSIAILLPFLLLTAMTGKLATYLLPLTGPMALLGARTIERWLITPAEAPSKREQPPSFVEAIGIATPCLLVVAAVGLGMRWPRVLPWLTPLALLAIATSWQWMIWRRRPDVRIISLTITWFASVAAWAGVLEIEDAVRELTDQRRLIEQARKAIGDARPEIALYGFRDSGIEFYARHAVTQVSGAREIQEAMRDAPDQFVLLVDVRDWAAFTASNPAFALRFQVVDHATSWPNQAIDILRPSISASTTADKQSQ